MTEALKRAEEAAAAVALLIHTHTHTHIAWPLSDMFESSDGRDRDACLDRDRDRDACLEDQTLATQGDEALKREEEAAAAAAKAREAEEAWYKREEAAAAVAAAAAAAEVVRAAAPTAAASSSLLCHAVESSELSAASSSINATDAGPQNQATAVDEYLADGYLNDMAATALACIRAPQHLLPPRAAPLATMHSHSSPSPPEEEYAEHAVPGVGVEEETNAFQRAHTMSMCGEDGDEEDEETEEDEEEPGVAEEVSEGWVSRSEGGVDAGVYSSSLCLPPSPSLPLPPSLPPSPSESETRSQNITITQASAREAAGACCDAVSAVITATPQGKQTDDMLPATQATIKVSDCDGQKILVPPWSSPSPPPLKRDTAPPPRPPEELWLLQIISLLFSFNGQSMDLAVLANPKLEGAPRPEGVRIKVSASVDC